MKSTFRQIALIGKYHLPVGSGAKPSSKQALQSIAQFLLDQGLDVIFEHDTASNTGITEYAVMDVDGIGKSCDLALVLGGDGTMLGYGRLLAKYDVPLIGINQGRLGFITDIGDGLNSDQFLWAPQLIVTQAIAGSGGDTPAETWDAKKDFNSQPKTSLNAWEQLSQVLMLSNEFMFVD